MAASNDQPQITLVPCRSGCRLTFSWGLGTELRLIELQPSTAEPAHMEDGNERQGPCISTVFCGATSPDHKAVSLKIMPKYSNLLSSQQQTSGLQAGTGLGSSTTAAVTQQGQLEKFARLVREQLIQASYSSEEGGGSLPGEAVLWSLLELLYIAVPASQGFLAEDLCAWLSEQSATIDALSGVEGSLEGRLQALMSSPTPDASPDYWPCFAQLVAVGRTGSALRLLEQHSAKKQADAGNATKQYELLDAVYVLIRQMPRFRRSYQPVGPDNATQDTGTNIFDNMTEYVNYKSHWQAQCALIPGNYQQLFDDVSQQHPATVSGIRHVLAVLAGDKAAATQNASTWLEAAVGNLLHVQPQLQLSAHAPQIVLPALQAMPIKQDDEQKLLRLIADLILAAAAGEVQEVVALLSSSEVVSAWFMCHVMELLLAVGPRAAAPLLRQLPLTGTNQVETYRMLLAETLMPSSSSTAWSAAWQLVLSYLVLCPRHGRGAAEALLEMLPTAGTAVQDEHLLRKVAGAARSLGLSNIAVSVHKSAGAAAWYAGQVGSAVRLLHGTYDTARSGVAMEPVTQGLTHTLLTTMGSNYTTSELPLVCGDELPHLLPCMSDQTASQSDSRQGSGNNRSWLSSYLQLQRQLQQLKRCLQEDSLGTDGATTTATTASAALPAARALMTALVNLLSATAPQHLEHLPSNLLLPLMTHLIWALELPVCALAASEHDGKGVAAMLDAANRAFANADKMSGPMQRCIQDVQLCLTRLSARAHVFGTQERKLRQ